MTMCESGAMMCASSACLQLPPQHDQPIAPDRALCQGVRYGQTKWDVYGTVKAILLEGRSAGLCKCMECFTFSFLWASLRENDYLADGDALSHLGRRMVLMLIPSGFMLAHM